MKKTLLLGTALVLGVAGYSQSTAKKAVNPKYLQKELMLQTNRTAAESQASVSPSVKAANKGAHQSTLATCTPAKVTTSWNCFGVGGGATTSEQNCLSYNKDLNVAVWTQRGSKGWAANLTSGYLQSTVINPATELPIDSFILYKGSGTQHEGRYPSGVLINPTTNTSNSYTNALAVTFGPTTDGTNWSGTAYTAKPLWSTSARTHVAAPADSLWTITHTGSFGNVTSSTFIGSPATDLTAMPDGKTVYSIGALYDPSLVGVTNANAVLKGILSKGVLDATGKIVAWSVDSTTFAPATYTTAALGRILQSPRVAFSPDGQTGYVLFIGRLATSYNNFSDSAQTPIVYKTSNGGTSWTQVLQGYDWVCKHPEVLKNVGQLTGKTYNYSFDSYGQGADLTVDANGVLHYVTTVSQPFHIDGNIDSLGVYSYSYDYDNANYHPIIWDFTTDGTAGFGWKTMMVDSILSAPLSSSSTDSTNSSSPMNGSQILGVSSHITVSRSTDGSTVFYGWADSDPGIVGTNATGATYNTSPDVLIKAYNVNTQKISATKNTTGVGSCFYPYLADVSYYDATQSAWVVPTVYTTGNHILQSSPVTLYDASDVANYFYSNCGTFSNAEISNTAITYTSPVGSACSTVGIEKHNAFDASISNYPNPFSNTTTIAVTLTESKSFNVNVYNAIGTLVYSKKVNGNVGENNVTFDAGSLSSGVYYYTVNAGNQQATKKMIIQK